MFYFFGKNSENYLAVITDLTQRDNNYHNGKSNARFRNVDTDVSQCYPAFLAIVIILC